MDHYCRSGLILRFSRCRSCSQSTSGKLQRQKLIGISQLSESPGPKLSDGLEYRWSSKHGRSILVKKSQTQIAERRPLQISVAKLQDHGCSDRAEVITCFEAGTFRVKCISSGVADSMHQDEQRRRCKKSRGRWRSRGGRDVVHMQRCVDRDKVVVAGGSSKHCVLDRYQMHVNLLRQQRDSLDGVHSGDRGVCPSYSGYVSG